MSILITFSCFASFHSQDNLTTSSKRYHYNAKQGIRNAKAEDIARLFKFEEEADRNLIAAAIGQMPSPQNDSWRHYVTHRLRMLQNGIATYTQRSYARIRLSKHIEWQRAIDTFAAKLVGHKPAVIHIGAGNIAANSPIRIKKHVRCPGTRKLVVAFKKRSNCVVRMVDEFKTSQLCGRCFKPFPRWSKSKRFKKCENCEPDERIRLPAMIVSNVSKRVLQMKRAIERIWREMRDQGDAIAAILTRGNTERLVSKKQRFFKNWQPNAVNPGSTDAAQSRKALKTVWHRDISAAKLILYKGIHMKSSFHSERMNNQFCHCITSCNSGIQC